jgi:hypothetical protein
MSAAYFCFRTLAPVDVLDDDVIVDPAFSFSFIAARVAECGQTHPRADDPARHNIESRSNSTSLVVILVVVSLLVSLQLRLNVKLK